MSRSRPSRPSRPRPAGSSCSSCAPCPEGIYDALPHGEFTILEAYLGALRAAERLIYLENQFLWSTEIVAVLRESCATRRDEFRIVLVLPSRPNNGADDTRGQLGVLVEADGGAGRFLACTLYAPATATRRRSTCTPRSASSTTTG